MVGGRQGGAALPRHARRRRPAASASCGASLGANLAALEAADDPAVASLALLSPSLDYRGLRIEAADAEVRRPADADRGERRRPIRDAVGARPAEGRQGPREILCARRGAGHGTEMLERDAIADAARWWTGSDARCYDRPLTLFPEFRLVRRAQRLCRLRRRRRLLRRARRLDHRQPAGAARAPAPAPAAAQSTAASARRRPPPPLDETRAAALRRRGGRNPHGRRRRASSSATCTSTPSGSTTRCTGTRRRSRSTPSDVNASTDLGISYYYTNQPDRALAQFDHSLAIDPKHAKTLLNIGIVRAFGKQDLDGAAKAWQQVLDVAPGSPRRARRSRRSTASAARIPICRRRDAKAAWLTGVSDAA